MSKDDVQVLKNGVLLTEAEGLICRIVYADKEITEAVRIVVQEIIERRRVVKSGHD
jgi:hypothetical protein